MTQEHERNLRPRSALREIPPGDFYVGPGTKIEKEFRNQQRILKFQEGAFPFPPIKKIQEILDESNLTGELLKSILELDSVSDEPFKKNIKKLLEIDRRTAKKVYIVGSGGGQDEIIERTITQAIDPITSVIAPAPFYPHVANFVQRNLRMPLIPIEVPLGQPYEDAVRKTINFCRKKPNKGVTTLVFLCVPSSPTGETVDYTLIEELVEVSDRKDPNDPNDPKQNDIIYIDLGLGFDLELARKLVKLAAKHPNVMIGFSLPSKELGVANLRFGFAVMSKEIGEVYENARRKMDIPGHTQLIMNKLSDPDIVIPQLKKREAIAAYWKTKLMVVLAALNHGAPYPIDSLLTDPKSLVMTLSARKGGNLYKKMVAHDIETAKGSAWSGTHSQMTDSQVRITPPMNDEDFSEFFRRLYMLINNRIANRDQSEAMFKYFMEGLDDYPSPPVFED